MHLRQGGHRAMPDGFLHLNNYSHTMASGIEGVAFERLFSTIEQEAVEAILKAIAENHFKGSHLKVFKHGCWRFRKEFLKEHFAQAVRAVVAETGKDIVLSFAKAWLK